MSEIRRDPVTGIVRMAYVPRVRTPYRKLTIREARHAQLWLRGFMAARPTSAAQIREAARAEGIAHNTLEEIFWAATGGRTPLLDKLLAEEERAG
jgi:hypothetical protein